MDSFLLTDLYRNIPGISYFNFVEMQGIGSIPADDASIIDTNITLKSGYAWKRGEMISRSGEYSCNKRITPAGPAYDCTVIGFYPKITPTITHQFYLMQDYRFVVVPKDQNLYKRLIGNAYTGARFLFNESTRKLGDASINGYEYRFEWTTNRPPLFYLPAEEDEHLIPEDVVYVPGGTFASFYYYNSSDAGIAASPPANNKRKFSVLAGKEMDDFAIWLNGTKLISNDPDASDNAITAIAGDGTVTLNINWGNNREILIMIK